MTGRNSARPKREEVEEARRDRERGDKMKMNEERTAGHATRFEREAGPTSCNYSYLRDVPGTLCLDPSFKLTEKPRGRRRESPRDRTKRCSERSQKRVVAVCPGPWTIACDLSERAEPLTGTSPLALRAIQQRSLTGSGRSPKNEKQYLIIGLSPPLLCHGWQTPQMIGSPESMYTTCSGAPYRDGGFLNHVQLVHEFRCSAPQPRAVPVTELLTVGPSPDEFFYPASTVLTRCDGAGCCPDPKQICAPVETRNVSLVFMVKHMIDRQRDRHHEVVHALEHTKCGCVDMKLIKFD